MRTVFAMVAVSALAIAAGCRCGASSGEGVDTAAADVPDAIDTSEAEADATSPASDATTGGEADSPAADTTADGVPEAVDSAPAEVVDGADGHVARPNTCTAPASAAVSGAQVPDGFCASIWATGLGNARGLFVTDDGDVLVVERSQAEVTVLWDGDGDGVSGPGERARLAGAAGLNHGVFVHGGFLYASSASTVFRWSFARGTRGDLGQAEVVVRGMPSSGHSTRTVVLDAAGRLYVSVGSLENLDASSQRARVRRFDLGDVPAGGIEFASGEVFADGLRNEVGLAFDAAGRLWGVQNGIDNLRREDLGGDIHEDNPAEILSRFDTPGAFHGYPYCWTEFLLPAGVGAGPGTMWAHPETMDDGVHDDAWCRDPARVDPPELAMQAHSAPLDLEFYDGASFPESYRGDLFITMHGSWNRRQPTGYKLVHVDIDANGRASPPAPFFEYAGQGDIAASWPHRPVGVRVGAQGQLFVSSDASDLIVVIGHDGTGP